jgi:hypothetical protein
MYRSTFSWPRHKLEVSRQLHAPAALPPGKGPRYPLDRRLGGPQSRSGRFGEQKIIDPTGTRTPTPRSSSPYIVAIITIIFIIIIIVVVIVVALQPFVGPWSLSQFLNPIHNR